MKEGGEECEGWQAQMTLRMHTRKRRLVDKVGKHFFLVVVVCKDVCRQTLWIVE